MAKSTGPKVLNCKKPAGVVEHKHGIPCPACGYRRLRRYSSRHIGNKIVRVRACVKCGHRVRTEEILQSKNAPRKFTRDPETRRKVPAA